MRRLHILTERGIQFKVSVAFEQEYFQGKSGNAKKIIIYNNFQKKCCLSQKRSEINSKLFLSLKSYYLIIPH